jgi:hypothetical protein
MKAAGVTTLVHAGDPLMFAQLTIAAGQQNWHPEILAVDPTPFGARIGDQSVVQSAMVVTPFSASPGAGPDNEPGAVFRLASGGAAPQSSGPDFVSQYLYVLMLFGALQAAGPNLTPDTFLAGMSSLPESAGGFGLWRPSQRYSMPGDFVIARWNPTAMNAGDGEPGDFLACDAGARYPLNPQSMGSGQLGC